MLRRFPGPFLYLLGGLALGSVYFAVLVTGWSLALRIPVQGSASAFLVAFTVGSAAIWMPCILQMVLVFCGLTAAGAQRFRGGRFFAAYIGTYAALGLVAARIRRGRGAAGGDRRGPGCRRGGDGLRRPVPSRRTPQPGHAGLRAAPWAS